MRKRLHRSTKRKLLVTATLGILTLAIFLITYQMLARKLEKNYGVQLSLLSEELKANKQYVYVAKEEIEAGEVISLDLLEYKEVYTGQEGETFIQEEDCGQVALVTIPQGTYIQKNMIAIETIEESAREAAYSCIAISGNVEIQDYIDVRIFYPNGEDYIVLSKKRIKDLSDDGYDCLLWMGEEELLLMSSAIVDAYLYQGAYLYATKYIEPTIQEACEVTYQPLDTTMNLIHEDPNIVEIAATGLSLQRRNEIENRLLNDPLHQSGEITWGVNQSSFRADSSETVTSGEASDGSSVEVKEETQESADLQSSETQEEIDTVVNQEETVNLNGSDATDEVDESGNQGNINELGSTQDPDQSNESTDDSGTAELGSTDHTSGAAELGQVDSSKFIVADSGIDTDASTEKGGNINEDGY